MLTLAQAKIKRGGTKNR